MRRILIVDDHRLFLDGMCHLLARLGDNVEIVESSSAENAIYRLDKGERFTLALVDLSMPGMGGLAFLQSLRERKITCPVVIVSAAVDAANVRSALQAGAMGYIPKSATSAQMLDGVVKVLSGEVYLSEDLWNLIDDRPMANHREESSIPATLNGIGERQLQVLALMNEGLPNKKIGTVLNISEATVKYHIGLLFRALNVSSRTACVRAAQERGIVGLK